MNLRRWRRVPMIMIASCLAIAAHAGEFDAGRFRVYVGNRLMGTETFVYDLYPDSLVITAGARSIIFTPAGEDSMQKYVLLHVSPFDLDLRLFQSNQTIGPNKLTRRITVEDTSLTAYREVNSYGNAEVVARPPGRLYIHDPQVFVLFDLIGRSLHRQEFDSRPINLFVLGPTDTTIEVTATKMGLVPLRWGQRALRVQKLRLRDSTNTLYLWLGRDGRMLQFESPASGLRVVRDPPPVKSAAQRRR